MKFTTTKQILGMGAAYVFMGAVLQSEKTAGGGVVMVLALAPVTLIIDYWRHRKLKAANAQSSPPSLPAPLLQLSPPEPPRG